MGPFYAEVKSGTERLANLKVDAKRHAFSSARLLGNFLSQVFILGRMSVRELGHLGVGYLLT